ncbi:multidrug efflux SMR transporter [Staphylococcus pseudoxylosus]|uniref:DMT family transporter n=1 Tax=Staphylococcus pseudoxylosus TaxID=2282419 RepID=UPI000D1F2BBF|nr:multidrug efflux SMR transporter [Staphylococcus pseudoxylosus]PTI58991.1 QacE family quaternary ammonium compound efflux SMR transporter [Staphylococcus xylosus]MDW8797265.1 multidrug efflux SMR transporter [Staphylococcus pseudoxylosus]MEB6036293.1 multidrug efflux SMR transporter [Staphylococcus pseudoxylosus]MEB6061053.1 multidrug efflux SMR transporter [Staphylococcus pseudoxylosus]MEB7763769.1 multidrug efflux SMR transporter [Staphylococcus pseudoxylosus]
MAWILLVVAGLFEMVGITFLNAYVNSGKFRALIGLVGFFSMSFLALSIAMLVLPMSTAYAVWTGIGAVGGALVGMIFYKESKDIKRVICILVILGSTVGLKLVS